jgi:transcriptional regulator with XRE-family HTH domain
MTPFGTELRQWRQARGLSQLELAGRADVSQRHISFLETGRSKPSSEMVMHLGRTLDVPPREQNALLLAAGHAAVFSETPLAQMPGVESALEHILSGHEPYMAVVLDRRWNVVASNGAAGRFMSLLFPHPPDWVGAPLNLMRLSFHPDGLRRHMISWDATATHLLRRLERDAAAHPHDAGLRDLLAEVRSYPDVPTLELARGEAAAADLVVPTTYLIGDREVSMFTTIAIIGDAHDLTLAELRIETFWPADEASATAWGDLVVRIQDDPGGD